MKICFEGPRGIGKSTISRLMSPDFQVIPEVNVLFRGEKNEGGRWYYNKQVDRYRRSESYRKVIFDGDIFQPLWYNWTYEYPEGFLPLNEVSAFYMREIRQGNIAFPDLYIVFHASIEQLRARKEQDKTRSRKNFEKHLKLVDTLPMYFGYMKSEFPELVVFISCDSVIETEHRIRNILETRNSFKKPDSQEVLEEMTRWLGDNQPPET